MNWKSMSVFQKIVTIISAIPIVVWLIYKVKPDIFPFDPTYPAIAVFTVCEAVAYWNTKRKWAYLLIAGAVISLIFCILELVLLK